MVLFHPTTVGPLRYAHQFEKTIGGAESNLSIALTRLGHQVGWMSKLGKDEFGLYMHQYIRGEGVDTSRVTYDDHHPTAVFFKERQVAQDPRVFYYRKGSAASCFGPADLDEAYIAQAKILHVTGITPALSTNCREAVYKAIEMARKHGLTIVFDPNLRLKLWTKEEAKEVLADIASLCDYVLPGLDEGELLTGEADPEQIAQALIHNGAKVIVIKLGERGAFYATKEEMKYVAGYKVEHIVDTVGAGDGFAAGFVSGLLRGWSLEEAVRLGNRVGAFALTVPGDAEGYPFWHQVDPTQGEEVKR